jgi:hypothetical protein
LLSAQITPQSQVAAQELGSTDFKGVQQWTNGVTRSLTDFSGWQLTLYDVIVVQPTYLFWGDPASGDGSTPATRPTSIDSANYQLRQ